MRIILFKPQIPQNTGNIVRTCAVTGTKLTLVSPLFGTSDRWLKRAGLDYWEHVDVTVTDELIIPENSYLFSSHAKKSYTDVEYTEDVTLIFGSETEGLPEEIHQKHAKKLVTIPMLEGRRCLNLATSVGIGVYEVIRQTRQTLINSN